MPYVKKEVRYLLDRNTTEADEPGDLNYLFTRIATNYLSVKGESYKTYNDIIGALECCKLELYRRMVAPYEDKKIQENGDVY